MTKTEFKPETFHSVQLIAGDINYNENLCTPGYPDFKRGFSKLTLNCPESIMYKFENVGSAEDLEAVKKPSKLLLPICIYSIISQRRLFKYFHLKKTIHIKKIDNDRWDNWKAGIVVVQPSSDCVPNPNEDKHRLRIEKEVLMAQKYTDLELEVSTGSGYAINFNLFDFVDFPILSGEYEVYFSANGLESNHIFVYITIN